jgi:hypothetical protein
MACFKETAITTMAIGRYFDEGGANGILPSRLMYPER